MSEIDRKQPTRAMTAREYRDTVAGEQFLSGDELRQFVELRRAGRMPIVLANCGLFYTTDNPIDPWSHKERIGLADLRKMILSRYEAWRVERAA